MIENNGHKEVETKLCPFLNKECIGEKCNLYSELIQNMAGFQKKFGLCAFNSVVLILSEMNQKATVNQQQKIQIPNIFKS